MLIIFNRITQMRAMITLMLFALMFDLGYAQCSMPYYPNVYIPAAGCSSSIGVQSGTTFYVSTNGAVNLGSNTFTLTYGSLPTPGTTWNVVFDASNLTLATATNVNLFGKTPLADYPGITRFYYLFTVVWSAAGSPTLVVKNFASLYDLTNVSGRTTFTGAAYFNDSVVSNDGLYANAGARLQIANHSAGSVIGSSDTSGNLSWFCAPWLSCGNSGFNGSVNYIGTNDTASLSFRVDNLPAGIVSTNKDNTALGVATLYQNTSGTGNTAIGYGSLADNTSGSNNSALNALENVTSGSNNAGFGTNALGNLTTGSGNTGLGYQAGQTSTTGSYNTSIGYGSTVTSASTHNAIALGANATASTNQLAVAGVEKISIPNMNNHLGYALIDTSGTGDYVPQPVPQTTPVIDSVTGTSSQTFTLSNNQTNILTASTTVSGATLAFPTASAGTIYVIWKVSTTTTGVSGTNTGTTSVPSTVAAGVSRKFVNIGGSWY